MLKMFKTMIDRNVQLSKSFFYLAMLFISFDIFLIIDIKGFTVRLALLFLLVPMGVVVLRQLKEKIFVLPAAFIPLLIWTFFIVLFIPNTNFILRNIGYAIWLIFYVLVVVTTVNLFKSKEDLKKLLSIYLFSFLFVSFYGLLQFFLSLVGLEPPFITQWWPNGIPRVNGFSYEPSYYATYLITGWVLSLYLLEKKITILDRRFLILTVAFTTLALILSSSRMGYIVMILWILRYPFLYIKRKKADKKTMLKLFIVSIGLLGLGSVLFFLLFDFKDIKFLFEGLGLFGTASHSSSTRITFMIYTLQTFIESPIFGYSLGGIPSAIGDLHNIVVTDQTVAGQFEGMNVTSEVLAASGAIGFIFFGLFMALLIIKPLLLSDRLSNENKGVLKGLVYSFVFLLIILQFNQNILRPYLWLHISLIVTFYSVLRKEAVITKRRFVIDIRMWEHSGIGTYIKNTVPKIVKKFNNVDFYLITDPKNDVSAAFNKMKNVSFIKSNSSIYSIKEQIDFILKIYGRYDYFWSPHYNIPLFFDGKLIVTVHDVFHLAMPEYNKGVKQLYAKLLFTSLKYRAHKVFTVSRFTKNELVKFIGINESKVIPILNGVDKELYNSNINQKVSQLPYILYVGNVKPHKNLVTLVKAFELIKDTIDHNLVIVGKKEGFITGDTEVSKMAEALGERVVFTGFIPDDVLISYYKKADLLVFPSLYEGFGLPPLEAMAVGCATAVSNIASIPEACENATVYFDPLDERDMSEKILKVLTDEGLKASLIQKGRTHVNKFSWENTASEIIRVLKEVLK